MNKVFVSKVKDYKNLEAFLGGFFEAIKDRFQNVNTVLLKPNLLQACLPERGVTTHPEFVKAVYLSIRKMGDFKIILGDSPGANMNYEKVLEKTGIAAVCQDLGIEVVRFESFKPSEKNRFIYTGLADEVKMIINLPKLKTHSLTGLTLGVKNIFGLIPGSNKVSFHREYPNNTMLGRKIYEFYSLFHDKVVTLLDGIIAHEGDGPSRGSPKQIGMVACSEDTIALDLAVTKLIGFDSTFCKTNVVDKEYELVMDNDICFDRLKVPVSMKVHIPDGIKRWVSNKIYVKPFILQDSCIKCGLCMKSCPASALEYKNNNFTILDKRCIECFCCHEVCESDAIVLKRSILHRVFVK